MDHLDGPLLGALGVPMAEEMLYRTLLTAPDATLADLTAATGWDRARLRRRLRALEIRGMVTRTPSRPIRFAPAPPDLVVEVLALQRREEIERTRLAAAGLTEVFRAAVLRTSDASPVQVVRGREAIAQCFLQMQRATRQEVLILDRPPYVVEPVARQTEVQQELLGRGVQYRTIYDREALAAPEQMEEARQLAAAGEQSRVYDGLPLKLVIADRSIGLVPFVLPTEREIVVLHRCALLDGLVTLFQVLWDRAGPLWPASRRLGPAGREPPGSASRGSGQAGRQTPDVVGFSDADERILAYAAAGFTDQAIARKLGVAQRTVERRMRQIMDRLGARTRFQAGLQAAARGLLTSSSDPA